MESGAEHVRGPHRNERHTLAQWQGVALGGSVNDEDASTASYNADLYDPATNTFSSAGKNAYPRLYHSVSLLLPDATIWFAGGNPERGDYEPHMEIYQPAYLFNSDGSLATRRRSLVHPLASLMAIPSPCRPPMRLALPRWY